MLHMRRWVTPLLAVAISLTVPSLSAAQPKPSASLQAKRAKVQARLKKIRAQVLRKRVGLDDATARRVEAIFEKYHAERAKQRELIRKNRKSLAKLVRSDSADQNAYSRVIAELRSADDTLARLRRAQLDELSKVLTPKQQAKLAVAVRQIRRRLREAFRDHGRRGGGTSRPDPLGL